MFQKKALVLAALMASAAVAQAQVKVYGYMELDIGSYKAAGATKSVTQVSSGNMMTSFIGFSGSEDLGGGLKAEFTLETFLLPDTGGTASNNAGNFWGRGSNVALSGGFGKVALGQYDNPLFISGLSYNPFGSSMAFSPTMRHYYGLGPVGVATGALLTVDTGFVNSITYETPDFGGFMASVQWSPKETAAVGDKDSLTVGASYNAGPLSLMAVYGDHGYSTAGGTFTLVPGAPAAPPFVPANVASMAYAGKQEVVSLNGSYDFGVVKAFVQYTDVDNEAPSNTDPDVKIYQIGASIPVTAMGKVMVSYGSAKMKSINSKDTIASIAYDHSLSKRTGVFVGYSSEKATGLTKGSILATGIRHSF